MIFYCGFFEECLFVKKWVRVGIIDYNKRKVVFFSINGDICRFLCLKWKY